MYTTVPFAACGDIGGKSPEREIEIIAYNEESGYFGVRLKGHRVKFIYMLYARQIKVRDELGNYYPVKADATVLRF